MGIQVHSGLETSEAGSKLFPFGAGFLSLYCARNTSSLRAQACPRMFNCVYPQKSRESCSSWNSACSKHVAKLGDSSRELPHLTLLDEIIRDKVLLNALELIPFNYKNGQPIGMTESKIPVFDRLHHSEPEYIQLVETLSSGSTEYGFEKFLRVLQKTRAVYSSECATYPQGFTDGFVGAKAVYDSLAEHGPIVARVLDCIGSYGSYIIKLCDWVMERPYIFAMQLVLALAAIDVISSLSIDMLRFVINAVKSFLVGLPDVISNAVTSLAEYLSLTNTSEGIQVKQEHLVEAQGPQITGTVALLAFALSVVLNTEKAKTIGVTLKHATILASGLTLGVSALGAIADIFPQRLRDYLIDLKIYTPLDGCPKELQDLAQAATALIRDAENEPEHFIDPIFCQNFVQLHDALVLKGPGLMKALPSTAPERMVVNALIRRMHPYRTKAVDGAGDDRRVVPVGLYLSGQPGIGKTMLTNTMAAVTNPLLPTISQIFGWRTQSKHWDGHMAQPCITVDDFGVGKVDSEIVSDMLTLMSDTPFTPPKAAVDDKGLKAKPKLVFVTSNRTMESLELGAPLTTIAFWRRFMNFKVTLKDGWSREDGTLDTAKVLALSLDERHKMPHLSFEKRVFTLGPNGSVNWRTTGIHNFTEVADAVRAALDLHEREYISMSEADAHLRKTLQDRLVQGPEQVLDEADEVLFNVAPQGKESQIPAARHPQIVCGCTMCVGLFPWSRVGTRMELKNLDWRKAIDVDLNFSYDKRHLLRSRNLRMHAHVALLENYESYQHWQMNMKRSGCPALELAQQIYKNGPFRKGTYTLDGTFHPEIDDSKSDTTEVADADYLEESKSDTLTSNVEPLNDSKVQAIEMAKLDDSDGDPIHPYDDGEDHIEMQLTSEEMKHMKSKGTHDSATIMNGPLDRLLEIGEHLVSHSISRAAFVGTGDFLTSQARKVADKMHGVDWPLIAKSMCALTVLAGIVGMFMPRTEKFETEEQGDYWKSSKKSRAARAYNRDKRVPKFNYTEAQMAIRTAVDAADLDPVTLNDGILLKKIAAAVVRISRNNADATGLGEMFGFISGRMLISPKHFYYENGKSDGTIIAPDTVMYIQMPEGKQKLLFDPKSLRPLFGDDMVEDGYKADMIGYQLPNSWNSYPDLARHYVERKDLDREFDGYFFLSAATVEPIESVKRENLHISWGPVGSKTPIFGAKEYITYGSRDFGECGCLVVGVSRGNVRILGMHAAKRTSIRNQTSVAVGIPLIRDEILVTAQMAFTPTDPESIAQNAIDSPPPEPITRSDMIVKDIEDLVELPPPPMPELPDMYVFQKKAPPSKTAPPITHLRKLGLGFYTTDQPSLLGRASDRRSRYTPEHLIRLELSRAEGCRFEPPDDVLEMFESWFYEKHIKFMRESRVLTEEEALNGVPSIGVKKLDLSTSAGYPYNNFADSVKPGKTFFVDTSENNIAFLNEHGRKAVDNVWSSWQAGERSGSIWATNLKDELRPLVKIQASRTRVTQASPFDVTICMKRLFGYFVGVVSQNHAVLPSAVGMNIYSDQYMHLADRFRKTGLRGFAGDIKKHEAHFKANMQRSLQRVMRRLYVDGTEEEHRMRDAAIREITETDLLVGDNVFRVDGVNPSGTYGTTVLFNYYLVCSFIVCGYIMAARELKPEMASTHVFNAHVDFTSFGDDHKVVVSQDAEFFGFRAMLKAMLSCGVKYTYADKELADPPDLLPEGELPFCGVTTFDRDGGRYAMRSMADIEKSLAYGTKDLPYAIVVQTHMNEALRWMFARGKLAFNQFRDRLLRIVDDHDFEFVPLDWKACNILYERNILDPYGPIDDENEVLFSYKNNWTRYSSMDSPLQHVGAERKRQRLLLAWFGTREGKDIILSDSKIKAFAMEEFDVMPQGLTISTIKAGGSIDYDQRSTNSGNTQVEGKLDKPNQGSDRLQVVRTLPDLASLKDNFTQALVLGDSPGRQALTSTVDFGTSDSETNISKLAERRQFLGSVQWAVGDPSGDILFARPLVPNMDMIGTAVNSISNTSVQSYVSQAFRYWKCGFEITVQTVASKFHNGRLVLCTHLASTSTGVPDLSDAMGQYCTVMDVTDTTSVHSMVIPYTAQSEMLSVPAWYLPAELSAEWFLYTMGEFSLRVLSPLRAPESVSQTVDINIFFRLVNPIFDFVKQIDPSIQVVQEYTGKTLKDPVYPIVSFKVEPQMMSAKDELSGDAVGVNLESAAVTAVIPRTIASDEAKDAIAEDTFRYPDALKRRTLVETVTWADTDPNFGIIRAWDAPFQLIRTNLPVRAIESFNYFRGSMTITIQVQSQTFQQGLLIAYFVPLTTAVQANTAHKLNPNSILLCPHVFLLAGSTTSAEMTIPFAHPKKHLLTTGVDSLGALVVMPWNPLKVGPLATGEDKLAKFSVYVSFSDAQLSVVNSVDQRVLSQTALMNRISILERRLAGTSLQADFEVLPQMNSVSAVPLASTSGLTTINDPLDATVAAPKLSPTMSSFGRDLTDIDINDMVKRSSMFHRGLTGDIVVKVGDLFVPKDANTAEVSPFGGPLRYFSPMYRMWKGTFIVSLFGDFNGIIGFTPDPNQNDQEFKTSLRGTDLASSTVVGVGPSAAYLASAGVQQVKIPFLSNYHALAVPRTYDDNNEPQCSTGILYGTNFPAESSTNAVFVAAGDDFRLGYLYCVPRLRHIAPPAP